MAQEAPRYNRFQYHKYHWKVYHGKSFHIYFPADAADSLYRFVLKEMPGAFEYINKATIKEVPEDVNIIMYPSVDQLYETNIGGYEPAQLTLPTFVSRATRVVLAYKGSYTDLRYQLREGLVRALWEKELQGSSIEEQANTVVSTTARKEDIPMWYKEGSIRYFAHGWTIEAEDKLRTTFRQNNFTSWQDVLNYQPRLGGHAFCYFLSQKYYGMAVAQTFFQVIKKKSLPKAIRLITKCSLDTLYAQCFTYYHERFATTVTEESSAASMNIVHKKGIVSTVLCNPDGSLISYVALADGKRTVYIYNTNDKKTKKIAEYKLPPWIGDHSPDQYPLLAWHKDGHQLYIAKPQKGKICIKRYDADGKHQETTVLYGVDGITSIEPLSDREFLLSAYRKAQSDIVAYNDNKETYTTYTTDEYDDAKPVLTGNGNDILFVSNRPREYQERKVYLIGVGYKKDTLWQGIYTIKGKEMRPVAIDTLPYIKWDRPVLLNNDRILVSTTRHGAEKNVVINYLTGERTNLGEYKAFQYISQSNQVSFYKTDKDSIRFIQRPLDEWINETQQRDVDSLSPWLEDHMAIAAAQAREDSMLNEGKDTAHYFMDDVFSPKEDTTQSKKSKKRKGKNKRSGINEAKPYVLQLHSAYFTAQVNNDYFINRYQPYAGYQGQFKFPEISGMTKGGFTDLLENHHFTIAYALPAATEGSTFFAKYLNTEKKIDWGFSYMRKVETLKPDPNRNWVDENGNNYPNNAKVKTHYYDFTLKHPLTYDCYLGLQIAVRQDKTVFLATDKYTLDFPPVQSAWSINTLSFHLNKLRQTIPYLFKGFKIDANADLLKGISHEDAFVFGSRINVRYDQPIYKYITLVTQLHGGYSKGDKTILYNLGGVDNNVTPRVDTSVHFLQSAPYAFQTLITPFRGYYQNTLFGDQYALVNADLYFPIFQTLIPIQTPLPFINNLQLGLLGDMAITRENWNDTNPNNSKWKSSYGLSARTTLAGYPLRLEVAWPGTFKQQPVWYFSLNLQ